jgi:hypothetical protein
MALDTSPGTATPAIWKVTCRALEMTLAQVLLSFSRRLVSVQWRWAGLAACPYPYLSDRYFAASAGVGVTAAFFAFGAGLKYVSAFLGSL